MFSGLTNQMSSWMGSVKGEGEETPPQSAGDEQPIEPAIAASADIVSQEIVGDIGGDPDASRYVIPFSCVPLCFLSLLSFYSTILFCYFVLLIHKLRSSLICLHNVYIISRHE